MFTLLTPAPVRKKGQNAVLTLDGEFKMRRSVCLTNAMIFVTILLLASTGTAYAYVDPGTGSYVIQLLIAGLAGIAFAIKIYWGRIKGLFSRSSSEGAGSEGDDQ